jgi:hypothetical protein
MKDWTGSKASIFKQMGASNHTQEEREENDFYATDPTAVDDLLKYEKLSNVIWECAVGEGHLANRLIELGHSVWGTDIIDRGWLGTRIVDFLNFEPQQEYDMDIVTNPPYKFCNEFILKALRCVKTGRKVCMFLKLTTLEGQKRYEQIYSKYPPKTVYVYAKRKECAKAGKFTGGSSVCYAWFVWEKDNYEEGTRIKWI